MTNANDFAFPVPDTAARRIIDGYGFPEDYLGMTKREYFAAMAMQGILAGAGPAWGLEKDYAATSLKYADALIEALNKQP